MSEWRLWRGALWIVGGLVAGTALIGWTIASVALARWFETTYGTDAGGDALAGTLMFLVCWGAAGLVGFGVYKAIER